MQKKVIALAVAGLMSGAAFAQSNVTISGRVDVGYHHSSVSNTNGGADTVSGIQSGIHDGSRIAFSGEENLGNGLKAIFMLEYSLANDTNSGVGAANFGTTASSRQSWLGLTGSFGTVTAGRIYTPSDDMGMFDSMDQTAFSPRVIMVRDSAYGAPGGYTDQIYSRWSNSVKYVSPTMSGFTASAIYGFGAINGDDTTAYNGTAAAGNKVQERAYGVGLTYVNGPVALGAFYDRANDMDNGPAGTAGKSGDDARMLRFGGSYDFGMFALMGTYEKGRDHNGAGEAVGGNDENRTWSVGATAPIGNGLARVMYARTANNDEADTPSDGATGWGIGYDYNLSKRTMLYSGYTRVNSGNGARYRYFADNNTPGLGGTYSGYGFGMIHKF